MQCSLPPHSRQTISFATYEEYETHYNKTHVNRCLECGKNFPTEHFLSLHLAENHNPLAEVLKARGERTYACFVEDCDKVCSTPQKRRLHIIDKHTFPKDYDFYIVDDGIDQRTSMLRSGRHRRKSSAAHHRMDIEARTRRRTITLGKGGEEIEGSSSVQEEIDSPSEDRKTQNHETSLEADVDQLAGAMSALKFVPSSIRFGRGRGKGRGGFSRS